MLLLRSNCLGPPFASSTHLLLPSPCLPSHGSQRFFHDCTGNRSPTLQSRNSTGFRGSNEAPGSASYERPSNSSKPSKPMPEANLPSQSLHWDRTFPAYRDRGSPVDTDLPVRRPRENDSPVASSLDAKRRRVDSVTTDSAYARRGRSRSPLDGRRSDLRSDPYAGSNRDRTQPYGNVNGTQSHIFRAILLYLTGFAIIASLYRRWKTDACTIWTIQSRSSFSG